MSKVRKWNLWTINLIGRMVYRIKFNLISICLTFCSICSLCLGMPLNLQFVCCWRQWRWIHACNGWSAEYSPQMIHSFGDTIVTRTWTSQGKSLFQISLPTFSRNNNGLTGLNWFQQTNNFLANNKYHPAENNSCHI